MNILIYLETSGGFLEVFSAVVLIQVSTYAAHPFTHRFIILIFSLILEDNPAAVIGYSDTGPDRRMEERCEVVVVHEYVVPFTVLRFEVEYGRAVIEDIGEVFGAVHAGVDWFMGGGI